MPHDPSISRQQHTQNSLHHAIDRITAAWPLAVEDADARGYPTGIDYSSSHSAGETTSVEAAALTPSAAVAWLIELHDTFRVELGVRGLDVNITNLSIMNPTISKSVAWRLPSPEHQIRQIIRLANTAAVNWPVTPKRGTTAGGVTVGQRSNDVELCVYCQTPVTGSVGDPIRRINGLPYHKDPCWYNLRLTRVTPKSA